VEHCVSDQDFDRLTLLAERARQGGPVGDCVRALQSAVHDATVLLSRYVPSNIVTMRSTVLFRDVKTRKQMTCTLVYPGEADYRRDRISVLSPLGSALLGHAVKDRVSYAAPAGDLTVEVTDIVYQPEASGDYES